MKIKQLTLSAMISSLIAVILFFDVRFSYVFSQYFGFILPIPIALLVINENRKVAWITCIATSILLFISGNFISLIYVIPSLIIGVFIGIIILKNNSKQQNFIYLAILNLIFVVIQYLFMAYLLKIEQNLIVETREILTSLNITVHYLDILIIVFVMLFSMSVLQTIIVLFIIKLIQIRIYKKNIFSFNLTYLQFSRIFGIISIGSTLFYMFRNLFTANEWIQLVTAVLIALIFVLNVLIGCSVISYYLIQKNKSKLIMFLPILCVIPITLTAVFLFGIIDHFLDLRKRF